ncbi:MAG: acyl-CoA dehydrogenase family protein, partial [Candidatus Kapaibacteriota bacterium]
MNFNVFDYYNIEELLSEEERSIREMVRKFVDAEVIPIIEKHYREGTFPMHLIPRLAELGLLGITLPQRYGGVGANYTSYGLAMMELERGDSAIRSFASVQNSLV